MNLLQSVEDETRHRIEELFERFKNIRVLPQYLPKMKGAEGEGEGENKETFCSVAFCFVFLGSCSGAIFDTCIGELEGSGIVHVADD